MPSPAMEPAIEAGSRVAVDLDAYAQGALPERGDVVLFVGTASANTTCGAPTGTKYIKRVVGLPGDRVAIRDGRLVVNGDVAAEPDVVPADYERRWPRVPGGAVLVLGDTRPASCDSHLWEPNPFLPVASLLGRARL